MRPRETLQKELDQGNLAPLHLWYGEDRYSMIEALKQVKQIFLENDPSGSAIEIYTGKDVQRYSDIIAAAQTPSFFARRLVVVDGLDFEKSEAEGLEALTAYCQDPNPDNCLVMLAGKVNRTRKLYKAMSRQGTVLEFHYPQNPREWQAWVREEAHSLNKKISVATANFFVERVGHQVGILSQELQKCALYMGSRPEITRADIEAVCVPAAETSIFLLLDTIANSRLEQALLCLRNVLREEYYMKVHAMIVRHIRLLLAAVFVRCSTGNNGGKTTSPQETLMAAAGIRSPYEAGKIYAQAGFFTATRLAFFLEVCLQCEIQIKNGGNPHFLLEIMIVKFCRSIDIP